MASFDESYEVRLSQQLKAEWYRRVPNGAGSELVRLFMTKTVELLAANRHALVSLLYGNFDIVPTQAPKKGKESNQPAMQESLFPDPSPPFTLLG